MSAAYDTKISLGVLDSLATWEKLNVASFLASAVAIGCPETHGQPFQDASKLQYLAFIRQPILIYSADKESALRNAYNRAREQELKIGIYPKALLETKMESQNHDVIATTSSENHDLIGIVVYGPSAQVDRTFKKLRLHK